MKALIRGLLKLVCLPFVLVVAIFDCIRMIGDSSLGPEDLWSSKIEARISELISWEVKK